LTRLPAAIAAQGIRIKSKSKAGFRIAPPFDAGKSRACDSIYQAAS
jgi:hypothetical protein